jgi:hypothetical protein
LPDFFVLPAKPKQSVANEPAGQHCERQTLPPIENSGSGPLAERKTCASSGPKPLPQLPHRKAPRFSSTDSPVKVIRILGAAISANLRGRP